MQSAGYWLFRIAQDAQDVSTDGLAVKTRAYGHINNAGCKGMATTFTAAHHWICRHLSDSMPAAKKTKRKLEFYYS